MYMVFMAQGYISFCLAVAISRCPRTMPSDDGPEAAAFSTAERHSGSLSREPATSLDYIFRDPHGGNYGLYLPGL